MGGGVLVIAFEFGNLCFNSPASEQSIIMVIASPSEFSSLDKFITAALTFLETDGELYGKRTVLYKERVNLPASNEDITFITEKINEKIKFMNDTPPSLTCLGAVAFRLYHKNMDFGILHSGAAYTIMPIGK